MMALMRSTRSMNISFCEYRALTRRHGMLVSAPSGICGASYSTTDGANEMLRFGNTKETALTMLPPMIALMAVGGVIISFRMFGSVVFGKPKSTISSKIFGFCLVNVTQIGNQT